MQVFLTAAGRLDHRFGIAEMHIEQPCRRPRPLDEPADLDEMPSVTVAERRVGNPLKEMRPIFHPPKELMRLMPDRLDTPLPDL